MPRRALIVAHAAGSSESVAGVLHRFGFTTIAEIDTIARAVGELAREPYDLVVVPLAETTPLQLTELESAVRRTGQTCVLGTAPAPDPELILRALRSGVHEFLVFPPDASELAGAVDRLMRRQPGREGGEAQTGQVFAVYSSKGGMGSTSVAVNLAHGIAHNHPQSRVALADLVVASGDVRVFLDLAASYHMGDLAAKLDRVDADLLYSLLTPHGGAIWVLPSPDDAELEDVLDAAAVNAILEQMRRHFAFTVLDCEHHLSERTLAAMDAADRIVIVTQLNVAALRSTQRTLGVCRRLGYPDEKLFVVVNRYHSGDVLSLDDAKEVLGTAVGFDLPNDYKVASAAVTAGKPVAEAARGSELGRRYVQLAATLAGVAPEAAQSRASLSARSRLGRLLGRKKAI